MEATKRRFQKLKEDYINKKSLDALILDNYETSANNNNINKSKKNILIDNEHTAWEQNFQINNLQRVALEVEHVSNNVMRNLDHQTNQIKNIKGQVVELDENIDQGDIYISNMYNQQRKKKLAIIVCSVIIALIFVVILIFKFMK